MIVIPEPSSEAGGGWLTSIETTFPVAKGVTVPVGDLCMVLGSKIQVVSEVTRLRIALT